MSDFVVQGSRIFFPKISVGGPPPTNVTWTTLGTESQFVVPTPQRNQQSSPGGGNEDIVSTPDGSRVFIGMRGPFPGPAAQTGQIKIFDRSGGTFTEAFALTPSDPEDNTFYAHDIGASDAGDVCVAAALWDGGTTTAGNGDGAIYIFEFNGVSWDETKISGSGLEQLGSAVTMSGDGTTVAAAVGSSTEIRLYRKVATVWTQVDSITNPVGNITPRLSFDGNVLIVGVEGDNGVSLYTASGNNWTLEQTITGSAVFGDGPSITRDGTRWCVSERLASPTRQIIHIYTRSGGTSTLEDTVELTGVNTLTGLRTTSITDDGKFIAVGFDRNDSDDGRIWILERDGSTWTENFGQTNPFGQSDSRFGSTVELSANGGVLFVGLENWDDVETNTGAFAVYDAVIT